MFTFTLTDEAGDTTEVKADSRDVLVWEKTSKSNERYITMLTEMSMVKFYRLAHIAAKRQGLVDCKLAEFETTYLLELEHQAVLPTSAGVSSET